MGVASVYPMLAPIANLDPALPFDFRIPAAGFMVLHLISEKVAPWENESFWVSLCLLVTVADFFVSVDLTTSIGFWLLGFHVLQFGGFRGFS